LQFSAINIIGNVKFYVKKYQVVLNPFVSHKLILILSPMYRTSNFLVFMATNKLDPYKEANHSNMH